MQVVSLLEGIQREVGRLDISPSRAYELANQGVQLGCVLEVEVPGIEMCFVQ
jgi:hypothetical protein